MKKIKIFEQIFSRFLNDEWGRRTPLEKDRIITDYQQTLKDTNPQIFEQAKKEAIREMAGQGGKKSAEKRLRGKTREERSKEMSDLAKKKWEKERKKKKRRSVK